MMDSDGLWHGSRDYEGNENPGAPCPNDRVIGIFILHRSYLRLRGVPKEELERETELCCTKPDSADIREREKKRKKKEKKKRYLKNKKNKESLNTID
jgi:hypothetical protein